MRNRISATDWTDGGWDGDDSVALARALADAGADLVDTSTGGNVPHAEVPVGPGYQVPFAERIRREAGVPTGAVGLITDPAQAEKVLATGQADVVLLARAFLHDPHWPLRAAHELGVDEATWPEQRPRGPLAVTSVSGASQVTACPQRQIGRHRVPLSP